MVETIHRFREGVTDPARIHYNVSVQGEPDEIGHWIGWLKFTPRGSGRMSRTNRATTQPDRDDLEYRAAGLETIYLEGALTRAEPG